MYLLVLKHSFGYRVGEECYQLIFAEKNLVGLVVDEAHCVKKLCVQMIKLPEALVMCHLITYITSSTALVCSHARQS